MQHRYSFLSWVGLGVLLVMLPLVCNSDASLSLLSQAGIWGILALSYNILLGHGGMLSFGHAIYAGFGAYAAIYLMDTGSGTGVPVVLLPWIGGVAGLAASVVFGYLTTRRSGTTLAMITLGLAELVHACAQMFPAYFGGEGGVTANRVYGAPVAGLDFIAQWQVYALVATTLFVCAVLIRLLLATAFGTVLHGVRDNAMRVAMTGHDPHMVRYLAFMFSAFFAGVAGALGAINFEVVSADNFSLARSASVLLFTYIGGVTYFWGPLLGAVTGVLFSAWLPAYTPLWQLYLGILFILVVMFVRQGLAGLVIETWQTWRGKQGSRAGWSLAALQLLLCGAGFILFAELAYRFFNEEVSEQVLRLGLLTFDSRAATGWCVALLLMGMAILLHVWRARTMARKGQA